MSENQPLLVEVTRGAMVESRHRVSFAVCDVEGKVLLSGGPVEAPIYGRSAIKPLQALALVESGAAEAFGLSDAEVALACASHDGEPGHVEGVAAWLARIGLSEADLECGAHLPYHEPSMVALVESGARPSQLHNNCSGKHAGFLTLARHLGVPTEGYIEYGHPVQQRVLGALEGMTGLDLGAAPRGIDGCGIPVIGTPLGNLALAMARLADPSDQPEARQAAARRICHAMAAEPFMVAGSNRFCTKVMRLTGTKAVIKVGAEGVYCGALPDLGLGIALKAEDGGGRAAEQAMARLLLRLGALEGTEEALLSDLVAPVLRNRAGTVTGALGRPADSPF